MENKSFLEILHKYDGGEATKEEKDYLENYYNLFVDEEDILVDISEEETEERKNEIKRAVLNEISTGKLNDPKMRFLERKFLRYAAAIMVFMIIGASAFYFINTTQTFDEIEMIADVPKENRVLYLPDGSKVILSGDSKLDYPATFDGLENREVTLTGEAYFDISHNASKPFIVHSGKIETVVLGTAFNIKAIQGQDDITVTVRRGKVKVVDIEENEVLGIITPNQQIVFNVRKVKSITNSVDAERYLTWMNADLFCDNLTLASVVELLEDKYQVKIEMEEKSIQSRRFTTTFSKTEKIENILETICLFNDLEYEYDADKSCFIITNKKLNSSPPKYE